jgi:restriction system protein
MRSNLAAQRTAERARAAYARAAVANEKERKRLYQESRAADVAANNEQLNAAMNALENLLADTLKVDDYIDFESLKAPVKTPVWQHADLERPLVAPQLAQFLPPPLTGLNKLTGKARYEKAVAAAHAAFQHHSAQYAAAEQQRQQHLAQARADHAARVKTAQDEAARQHAEIDAFRAEFTAGEPDAVVSYFDLVLQRSAYPEGFPRRFKLAYVPDSKQLVVEYQLPDVSVVPAVKLYKYVKTSDSVTETARPATQIKQTYASVVAQMSLRTVHELFEADRGKLIDTIVFNGIVATIDKGTGHKIRPCLVTLRTTRQAFAALDLKAVDPQACLKHLSAGVSKSPAELLPVRPVLEFDMVDRRFIEESDAVSLLDTRPNLMDLTPTEFEALIQNLFTAMGLEARQTQASRDGGVDCVAWDPRPIFGGKVVIQAKRYKNTVGVSAVRDLYGTLQNEGASKGILVTTSGYGQASFEFAKNKPIELIDGANLLYLLHEHNKVEARIVMPEDWHDPAS